LSTSINIAVVAKDQATKQLRGMGRQIEGFAKAASTAFIGIGASVVGAVGGLLKIVTTAAQVADDLNTLSAQTGLTVEQIQELAIVAEQTGTQTNTLARGAITLMSNLEMAKDPASAIAGALNELGINILDVNGNMRPMSELFPEIIDALRNLEDPTDKARIASQLFSRFMALELMPILELTDEEYKAITDRAYEMGRVLGQDQVDELNKANNAWKEMKGIMEIARSHLATALLPIFERLNQMFLERGVPAMQGLIEKVEAIVGWYMNLDDKTKNLIDKLVLFLAALLPIGLGMKGIMAAAKPLITIISFLATKVIIPIVAALGWWVVAIAAVIAAGILLYKNWDTVKAKAIEIWTRISDWFRTTIDNIRNWFTNLAKDAAGWGKNMLQGFLDGAKGMFSRIKETISGFISGIGDSVKNILGIKSPSSVFADIGENMGLGLEMGLSKSMANINMDKLVPVLSPGGARSYSITNNIQTGSTPLTERDFVRLLDTYWRKASRERGL
jgi:hypothetical protein